MEPISSRNVDFIRNAAHTGEAGRTARKEQPAAESEVHEDSVKLSDNLSFQYSAKDLTSDGKLRIIVEGKDQKTLDRIKHQLLTSSEANRIKADLPLINGFAAEVEPNSKWMDGIPKKSLNSLSIYLDKEVSIPRPVPTEPRVEPKLDVAAPTLGVDKIWEKGFKGQGVTIAVIDTGIDPHPDLKDRIIAFKDLVNNKTTPYDDQGHGTHCAGDAAGSGSESGGKYVGPAPEANLVGVKVLDGNGSGTFSDVIAGIQWAVDNKDKYGINVISMSLGGGASESYKDDPVAQAVEKAVEKGIVTVVAAGNEGPSAKTIGTPAHAEHVITVGAMDDKGTVDRSDDKMAYFSSRGPTTYDGLTKPDIVTPGVNIKSTKPGGGYTSMSGTSMATPVMSGLVALMLSANPGLSPEQVKNIYMQTADKLKGYGANDQGAGVADPVEAIEKAIRMKETSA